MRGKETRREQEDERKGREDVGIEQTPTELHKERNYTRIEQEEVRRGREDAGREQNRRKLHNLGGARRGQDPREDTKVDKGRAEGPTERQAD